LIRRRLGSLCLVAALLGLACGKKGPPLPPLVRLPLAPADFSAVRRGSVVSIQFAVPAGNTDGSTPADLARVDVYALTGASTVTPDEILKRGVRVGSVLVNPPPDPDASDADRSSPPVGDPKGLDQGAIARLTETFAADPNSDPSFVRSYIGIGFNQRGRRGDFSMRALVPIMGPPRTPSQPEVTWNESEIFVAWPAVEEPPDAQPSYHVYSGGQVESRLTQSPISETRFVDRRIEWGSERCYRVRTVRVVDTLTVESEPSPATCVTPVDTFPPAPPKGLNTIASEGAVNLIWDPNGEKDLAGYIVLRAVAPDSELVPITSAPIVETTFRDSVRAGSRITYGVRAVDKVGNASPVSATVQETAR
jgi:hypothetical protein